MSDTLSIPLGNSIYINPQQYVMVRPPVQLEKEGRANIQSVITMSNGQLFVDITPDRVHKLVNGTI